MNHGDISLSGLNGDWDSKGGSRAAGAKVCGFRVGARKDTRQILRLLYSRFFGVQAPKLETRIQLEFPVSP